MEYIIKNDEEFLSHYGVVGMKWGVRRASKQLSSARTKEDSDKAISKLSSHKIKATNKLGKLENKASRLTNTRNKQMAETDKRAAKLRYKAAINQKKAYGLLSNDLSRDYRTRKARNLNYKASKLEQRSADTISKIEKNRRMQEAFKKGINDIDSILVEYGKDYVNS